MTRPGTHTGARGAHRAPRTSGQREDIEWACVMGLVVLVGTLALAALLCLGP